MEKFQINNIDSTPYIDQTYNEDDINLLSPININKEFGEPNDIIEMYIISPSGDILISNYNFTNYKKINNIDNSSLFDTIVLNPEEDILSYGYNVGQFDIIYNFKRLLFNSSNQSKFFIKEISRDRTEIKITSNDISYLKSQADYIVDRKGKLVNKFGVKRKEGYDYSKDFHAAMVQYLNDITWTKHMQPIIPLVESVEQFAKSTGASKGSAKNLEAWIGNWKKMHIYKDKPMTKFPEVEAFLKFLRKMTSLTSLAFNVKASIMNISLYSPDIFIRNPISFCGLTKYGVRNTTSTITVLSSSVLPVPSLQTINVSSLAYSPLFIINFSITSLLLSAPSHIDPMSNILLVVN